MSYTQLLFQLLRQVSTELPADVRSALEQAASVETAESPAQSILQDILRNVELAAERQRPLCQDTGTIQVFVRPGLDFRRQQFLDDLHEAVREATAQGLLRKNCVLAVSGKNTGDNLGPGSPSVHWLDETNAPETQVTVLLKGGGSENMSCQYSLPDIPLHAARDLDGIRRCVLDAVTRIQGQGCAPGILGVVIGGDRAMGYEEAKQLLLRPLGSRNPQPELAALEKTLLEQANSLGIGPMGLGGKTTLLDVFVKETSRHPASFFVTIAYNCWCCRRQTVSFKQS